MLAQRYKKVAAQAVTKKIEVAIKFVAASIFLDRSTASLSDAVALQRMDIR